MLQENLVEDFTMSFRANWDRVAFSDFEGATYTYGDVVNRILRLHYGLGGAEPMTLKEIGQEMNLTRERIRQIRRDALAKLCVCMSEVG